MSALPLPLQGKNIVITGGTRGIGAAIALAVVKQGARKVILGYRSDQASAESVLAQAQKLAVSQNTTIRLVKGDLVDETSCTAFVAEAARLLGGEQIDGLVLSAGVLRMINLSASTDKTFDEHFGVNVKGTLFTIKAALPHIADGGRIVPFSTSVLATPQALGPGYLEYVMAKAAVEQMVKVLQRDPEIGGPDRRIGINAMAPGATGTDLFYAGKSQEVLDRIAAIMPQKRIGAPDEIADATVFLLSDASRWVQGQILRVNGGQTL